MPSIRAQRTRDRLQEVALRLIVERGYERTTVEQIAAAAGVSHMTFFRYFPTKESVVLDDPFDPTLAAAVAAASSDLPALQRACRGLRAVVEHLELPDQEQVRARVRIGAGSPTLLAGMWANTVATQEAVAQALAPGLESEPGLPERVAAAAAVAALTTAVLAWSLGEDNGSLAGRLVQALDVLDPEGGDDDA
ncbi:MAG: TetR family transcriptional regulator [Nocardioidaceae bacterium]